MKRQINNCFAYFNTIIGYIIFMLFYRKYGEAISIYGRILVIVTLKRETIFFKHKSLKYVVDIIDMYIKNKRKVIKMEKFKVAVENVTDIAKDLINGNKLDSVIIAYTDKSGAELKIHTSTPAVLKFDFSKVILAFVTRYITEIKHDEINVHNIVSELNDITGIVIDLLPYTKQE